MSASPYTSDIHQRLEDNKDVLTRRDKEIGAWLEAGFEQIAFLTIHQASKRIGVSEASIVRFAQKLGYGSYSAMQQAAQELIQEASTSQSVENNNQIRGSFAKAFYTDIENLQNTYNSLSQEVFNRVVERLASARRIVVLGLRASHGIASYFSFSLALIRPDVSLLQTTTDNVVEQLIDLGEDDLLFAISLMKPAWRSVEIAREAKENFGIPVITLTNSQLSAINAWSDETLLFRARGTFSNYTAAFSLSAAILEGTRERLGPAARERHAQLDKINVERARVIKQ